MPFVMINDEHNTTSITTNLSTYIIPEFYIYSKLPKGVETWQWLEAVDCLEYYTDYYGSYDNIPVTLQRELTPLRNTNWLCPNIPKNGYVIQNDPNNQNFGINMNFVVNYCSVSAARRGINDPNCISNITEAYDYI